ncbi:MAG: hypothetical protein N2169_07945, partial [bacterium]|nr:hypothetical protein [bacterium]
MGVNIYSLCLKNDYYTLDSFSNVETGLGNYMSARCRIDEKTKLSLKEKIIDKGYEYNGLIKEVDESANFEYYILSKKVNLMLINHFKGFNSGGSTIRKELLNWVYALKECSYNLDGESITRYNILNSLNNLLNIPEFFNVREEIRTLIKEIYSYSGEDDVNEFEHDYLLLSEDEGTTIYPGKVNIYINTSRNEFLIRRSGSKEGFICNLLEDDLMYVKNEIEYLLDLSIMGYGKLASEIKEYKIKTCPSKKILLIDAKSKNIIGFYGSLKGKEYK